MDYPELVIDYKLHPNLADNIWHAQMAGWPRLLTYNGPDQTETKENRHSAMRFEHEGANYRIPQVLSRDEYPFACTNEGGGVHVGHIPAWQNSAQGGLISAFLRRHQVTGNRGELSKFLVTVINHPGGPVATSWGVEGSPRIMGSP